MCKKERGLPYTEKKEQETVTTLRQIHPDVALAYDLVQQFARMLRTRTGELLRKRVLHAI